MSNWLRIIAVATCAMLILGVFQRRDGATRQICEYHVHGQDYQTTKTWEVLP